MPSTASSASRDSVSNGAARVTISSSSATVQRSMTAIATSCWASTSSGLRGMTVVSIAPSCIRWTTTAASSRSPRNFGKSDALRRLADLVAGAADALQPGRDARRRLDEDDEVDGAHVDAELERGGRDDRRDPAGLEVLLDLEPLLARDRAVVGADELLAGQLVEALREPLGEAPAVREDDRAAVGADELEEARVDRGPDARAQVAERDRPAGLLLGRQDLAEPGHVLDRDDDLELERLAAAGIDDLDLAARPDPAEEPGDRLERPLGRREADALERRRVRRAGGAPAARARARGARRASCPRSRGPRR